AQYMHMQWYRMDVAECDGVNCELHLDAHPSNGQYDVWVQSWGPAGYTNGDPLFWIGPLPLSIQFDAPGQVMGMTITSQSTFIWNATEGTTWYNVWIGTADWSETLHFEWHAALDLGCADAGLCILAPEL